MPLRPGGIAVAYLFQISALGPDARASRDDDVAAKASAVHIVHESAYRLCASAAMVGAGGGLYAQFLGSMTVDQFYLEMSFVTLAMLVVGGIGSLTGAVIGVVVVTAIIELLRFLERGVTLGGTMLSLPQGSQEIGLGIVMALILIYRPNGVSGGRELSLIRRRTPSPVVNPVPGAMFQRNSTPPI